MECISAAITLSPLAPTRPEDDLSLLLDRYEQPLYRFLLALVHDPDLAHDCAQDAFLRAYEALRRGKQINRQWLFTVARNRAMDEFRRRRHMHPDADTLDRVPVIQATDRSLAVREALEKLPPLDREVLYLFAIAGFKTDEIGTILGVRGTAIRQRLYRAREKFRMVYGGAA
jgi:RNA polymerase sigma-70 factor (ECF subfamily)